MTALDFYNVDKSLATTAFSMVVTYIIILIQFDLCKSTTADVTTTTPSQNETTTMSTDFTTAL